jgi:hypothetical protein
VRARYHDNVRDVVFLGLVLGFFASAVFFVRACELVLRERSSDREERAR